MSQNPWIQFLKEHSGEGKKVTELRDMYLAANTDAPPVYLYDDTADIKQNSMLEQLKADRDVFPDGIQTINKKLERHYLDDITPKEQMAWRLAFEMALSDDYTLSKEQLLGSHDWWTCRMLAEADIDAADLDEIIIDLQNTPHTNIYDFLDDVQSKFNIEQLYAIGMPDLTL